MARLKERIDTVVECKFLINIHFDHPKLCDLMIPYWSRIDSSPIEAHIN
jgi:siroheme synthase (precorrin-2 oxidase/ferrochelatase)